MNRFLSSLALCPLAVAIACAQSATPLNEAIQAFAGDSPSVLAEEAVPKRPPTSEELELSRLDALPPVSLPVQEASLATAIQVVASAAAMNFVAPEASEFSESVTLSAKLNPWKLLKILGERYRFHTEYKEGLWLFHRDNPSDLVSRTYQLKNTNLDVYKASQNSFNMLASENLGGEGNGGSASSTTGGMVFEAKTQKIIDDIRELIGAAPQTKTVKSGAPKEGEVVAAADAISVPQDARVLYLPDVNSLYVTATSKQHERVAEYLKVADKPVRQIRIEARFFETTKNPQLVLGIDPTNFQPSLSLSNVSTQVNLGRVGATPYPDKALLSADTLKLQLNALQTDEQSRLINNPTVVVANNREAYFSVGDEEPFVSANSINPGGLDGGFGSTQARVAIRRIGTSVNIIPTLFPGDEGNPPHIRLTVRIEVGVLKGFRHLNSVDVPVVSSQKYEYTVFLKVGETLAFGGLAGIEENDAVRKVPLMGDIPVLGYLFRSHSKKSTQRNLVAYLTASVVDESVSVKMPPVEAQL